MKKLATNTACQIHRGARCRIVFVHVRSFLMKRIFRFVHLRMRKLYKNMEIIVLMRYPDGTERPADCGVQKLTEDQLFSEAEGLEGGLGRVFDQDFSNLKAFGL